jgi:hypothetical protein
MQDKDLLRQGVRSLQKAKNDLPEDWAMIEQYLVTGGAVPLDDHQQAMYQRWLFIDEELRKGKWRRYQIVDQCAVRFGVSKEAAKRDMIGCEQIFSSSYPLNKKYFITSRINFLERMIQTAAAVNDHKAVVEYEKLLEKYIGQYPDATVARSPKKIVFVLNNNVVQNESMPVEDAIAIVEKEASKTNE